MDGCTGLMISVCEKILLFIFFKIEENQQRVVTDTPQWEKTEVNEAELISKN